MLSWAVSVCRSKWYITFTVLMLVVTTPFVSLESHNLKAQSDSCWLRTEPLWVRGIVSRPPPPPVAVPLAHWDSVVVFGCLGRRSSFHCICSWALPFVHYFLRCSGTGKACR